jgi:hypothetical protein
MTPPYEVVLRLLFTGITDQIAFSSQKSKIIIACLQYGAGIYLNQ